MTPEEFNKRVIPQLIREMSPRHCLYAMRNAMAMEARRIANVVKSQLPTPINTPADRRGVRAKVYRDCSGFAVRTSTSRKSGAGMHRNRFGLQKPVVVWFNGGTKQRYTSTKGRRGAMTTRHVGFIDRVDAQERGRSADNIRLNLTKTIERTARKYDYLQNVDIVGADDTNSNSGDLNIW